MFLVEELPLSPQFQPKMICQEIFEELAIVLEAHTSNITVLVIMKMEVLMVTMEGVIMLGTILVLTVSVVTAIVSITLEVITRVTEEEEALEVTKMYSTLDDFIIRSMMLFLKL